MGMKRQKKKQGEKNERIWKGQEIDIVKTNGLMDSIEKKRYDGGKNENQLGSGRAAIIFALWLLSARRGRPVHCERRWPAYRHLGQVGPFIATARGQTGRTGRTVRVLGQVILNPGNSIR